MCNGGTSKSKSAEAFRLSTVRSVGASASTVTRTWDNGRLPVIRAFGRNPSSGTMGGCTRLLQGRQYAGEDFEPKVVFVAQAVGATLDHPDIVVEPFDEA